MGWFSRKNKSNTRSLALDISDDISLRSAEEKVVRPCKEDSMPLSFNSIIKKYSTNPMELSSIFCAVNMISNAIAQMPWKVKYKNGEDAEDTYIDHLFDNTVQTKFIMIKNVIRDALVYGDGFIYIERDDSGMPINLIYVEHGKCSVMYNIFNKNDVYYSMPEIDAKLVPPENVIHIYMYSDNGITGISLFSYAYKTIGLSNYTEKSAYDYFASNMRVLGILTTDNPILDKTKKKEFKATWRESQLGDGNGICVLENGMKYQPISSNARDAQLLDSRIYNLQEFSRFALMNPVLMNDLSKSNYNTLEQANLEFESHTLAPWIINLEEEVNRKLILPKDRNKIYIDIEEEAIIKSDKQTLANYLTTLVDKGIMTRNEARKMLKLNPIEGGDDLIVAYTDVDQNKINNDDNSTQKQQEQKDE